MAVTVNTAAANAMLDTLDDRVNLGAAAGTFQLQTSGDVEVATLTFDDPAFGAASSKTLTAGTITQDSSATGGTATKLKIFDSDANLVLTADITSTVIGAGNIVTCSAFTISMT